MQGQGLAHSWLGLNQLRGFWQHHRGAPVPRWHQHSIPGTPLPGPAGGPFPARAPASRSLALPQRCPPHTQSSFPGAPAACFAPRTASALSRVNVTLLQLQLAEAMLCSG